MYHFIAGYLLNAIEIISRKYIARELRGIEYGCTELPKRQKKNYCIDF